MNILKAILILFLCIGYDFFVYAQKPDRIRYFSQKKDLFVEVYENHKSGIAHNQFLKRKISNKKTELVCAITDTSTILRGHISAADIFTTLSDTTISLTIGNNSNSFDIITLAIFERKKDGWYLRQVCPIAKRIQSGDCCFDAKIFKKNVVQIDFGSSRLGEIIVVHPNNKIVRYIQSPRHDIEFIIPDKH